ncbi:hypothetical protein ACUXZZ_45150 (plasmid) [Streptomyces graminifolii]|uniref:hypothetical protein n=1 Tax=Streptomyces graminifolii TaxID=1266771 RepID=UPI00405843B9
MTTEQPRCTTAAFFRARPTDLITWSEAEAAVATSPYPMSARDLRRKFKAADRPLWKLLGKRGELVSRSALLEFHRDLANQWIPRNGRRT